MHYLVTIGLPLAFFIGLLLGLVLVSLRGESSP